MTPIHFAHAVGFPASTYSHFFAQLSPFSISSVECLGHGAYRAGVNWHPLAQEVIESIETQHQTPVIGMGHSMGGVLILFAAQARPDLFTKIILMDPPIMHPKARMIFGLIKRLGLGGYMIPPARKAKKRRTHFRTKEEAYDYWRPKALFRNFDERCFQDYVEHGLVAEADGFRLVFSAQIEYELFCSSPGRLGNTYLQMPSYFIHSQSGQVLRPKDIAANQRIFSQTTFVAAEGGHLFPLEYPEATARLIKSII